MLRTSRWGVGGIIERQQRLSVNLLVKIAASENNVVIKTLVGSAQAVAALLMGWVYRRLLVPSLGMIPLLLLPVQLIW